MDPSLDIKYLGTHSIQAMSNNSIDVNHNSLEDMKKGKAERHAETASKSIETVCALQGKIRAMVIDEIIHSSNKK